MRLPRGLDLEARGLEERPGEVECGRRTLRAKHDIDLDSAGDRFGAKAEGGWPRRVLRVAHFCEIVARTDVGRPKIS